MDLEAGQLDDPVAGGGRGDARRGGPGGAGAVAVEVARLTSCPASSVSSGELARAGGSTSGTVAPIASAVGVVTGTPSLPGG